MRPKSLLVLAALWSGYGCSDDSSSPAAPAPEITMSQVLASPPGPMVPLPVPEAPPVWPWLSEDLSGQTDPLNLVFHGRSDARQIRAALLGLDGNRTPLFPPAFPFDCTWSDAIGGLQAAYGEGSGWAGGAIQLQCGRYGPLRFHLRLFDFGSVTLGGAHFELQIPGTTEHQVLSWELAEQLVTFDLARTGLLGAAPTTTAVINDAPAFRTIPAVIYNGLPVELRGALGTPLGDVGSAVGIGTDGRATVLALGGTAAPAAGSNQDLTIEWNQVIPRPFCATGPGDFLRVQGPVHLSQQVELVPGGGLRSRFRARGELQVTPVDPVTGQPAGPTLRADVDEQQDAVADGRQSRIHGTSSQMLKPLGQEGAGAVRTHIRVGPDGRPEFQRSVKCLPAVTD